MTLKREYSEFRNGVKEQLKQRLSAWNLSDEDLEKYLAQEEEQIKGAYEDYVNPDLKYSMDDDSRFKSEISSIAMCLEYCYE